MLKSWFATGGWGGICTACRQSQKSRQDAGATGGDAIVVSICYAADTVRRDAHFEESIQAGSNVNKCRNTMPAVRSGKENSGTKNEMETEHRTPRSVDESDEIMPAVQMKPLVQEHSRITPLSETEWEELTASGEACPALRVDLKGFARARCRRARKGSPVSLRRV